MVTRTLARLLAVLLLTVAALGQDVQMNVPDHKTTTKGNHTTQSETNHAVTANGIIAAWNDSSLIATEGTEASSRITWRWAKPDGNLFEGGDFLMFPNGLNCIGDPAVVADSAGFIYVMGINEDLAGVGIARTTGTMWPYSLGPAQIIPAQSGMLDKELMTIDRTGGPFNDRIYITAKFGNDGIVATHTTSLNPIQATGWSNISEESFATGAMPAVAPNGDVYAVWQRDNDKYEISRSTNGGVTWSNPDPDDPAKAKLIATVDPSPLLLKAFDDEKDIRANHFPQLAIDSTAAGSPTRGNLYVVYHADPDGDGPDQADIFFTRSITDGKTWSKPRSITSGLAATIGRDLTDNDSFIPAIAVSPVNGHIYVSFWDRREDTSANDGDPANRKTRLYRALSTDAGQTWNVIPFAPPPPKNPFVPVAGFTVGGFTDDGEISNYWSEYNWITADANRIHFTWSDARNLCEQPDNASDPCTPAGRPDPDVYYRRVQNLSGADLFIKPWGAVTGEGPKWKTSYIYVVDASDVKIDAVKGVVNHLRARVRNLGTAGANGVTVRFKFAPWFAGLNDAMMKEIGTKTVSLSPAGGATDNIVVPIDWDLTDLTDTNGGKWPSPVGKYEHFCVRVSVELPSDINQSNNVAQSNFFDVGTASTATSANAPMDFIIAGPDPEVFGSDPAVAQVVVGALPAGFGARVTVEGVTDPASGFRLQPNELRRATVHFTAPADFQSDADVVADITLLLGGRENGGISARLYDSPRDREPDDPLGPTTAPYWERLPPDRTQQIRGEEGPRYEPPPMRTIHAKVRFRETLPVSYDDAYRGVLAALRDMELGPSLANEERGLFNTTQRRATQDEIARLTDDGEPRQKPEAGGYYWLSVWLQPRGEKETEIGVSAWIGVRDVYVPERRLRSNGILEKSVLAAVRGRLGE